MKLLINGYTLSERIEIKKQYYSREDISKLDKIIGHLKRNRKNYMRVVVALSVLIDLSGVTLLETTIASTVITTGLQSSLSAKAQEIIDLLNFLARYACMGMGLKEMIITLLNGGNLKEATYSGLQYWLGFLFLKFYPSLYN